jgi:hypothetical protein
MKKSIKNIETKAVKNISNVKGGHNGMGEAMAASIISSVLG